MRVTGDVALQNTSGNLELGENMNDVREDLQSGKTAASPYLRVEADWGAQRMKFSGFGHNSAGTGVLTGDFGDIPAGSNVNSETDFLSVAGSWTYDLVPADNIRIAPGVLFGYYSLDVSVGTQSLSAVETVDTDLVVPMPYLEAEVDLDFVTLQANIGMMSGRFGDANGRYWDAEALAVLRPADSVEILGGFRYLLIDSAGTAGDRDFDADVSIYGFFVGAGVTF